MINHWQVALNQVCVIPFDTGSGYRSNYTWGGVKTGRKAVGITYMEKSEYKALRQKIKDVLLTGEMNVIPHLKEFDISTKAKRDHIKAVKFKLGIRRTSMSSQILGLIEDIGMDHKEIIRLTGAKKEYIDQVISRNKKR